MFHLNIYSILKLMIYLYYYWGLTLEIQRIYYTYNTSFFKRFYLFIFREREREGERERNINMWLPLMRPLLGTWSATQACALDWESHWRPFGSQACTESSELHQPGLTTHLFCSNQPHFKSSVVSHMWLVATVKTVQFQKIV